MFSILTIMVLLLGCVEGPARGDETDTAITVKARARMHSLNPLIFGQNILFASNSLWNTRIDDIDPSRGDCQQLISMGGRPGISQHRRDQAFFPRHHSGRRSQLEDGQASAPFT